MNRLLLLAVALLLLAFSAKGATLYVDVVDWRQQPLTNRNVTLKPDPETTPPRTYAGEFISKQAVTVPTSVLGRAWFSNIVWGTYRLEIAGTPITPFSIIVPDTNGILNAASLRGTTNVPPQVTQYYTAAQVDALLSSQPSGTGIPLRAGTNASVVSISGTNVVSAAVSAADVAGRMATNGGTSWSGTFYNPTFADEVGSATINELTVSGALILGSSGSVIFGTNNAPLLHYAPSLLTWTIPVTFTNAVGSRVAFLDDIGGGTPGESSVTWDADTMVLTIAGAVTVVDWDSDNMVLTLSY